MKKLKVYLSGAVLQVDKDFQDWRNRCNNYDVDMVCINPIEYFNYDNKAPQTTKQCLNLFMHQIEHSDVVLVNLDESKRSLGTAMEVEHAFCKDIPIVAFGKKSDTWYNWITERATIVFESVYDALNYIYNAYDYLRV